MWWWFIKKHTQRFEMRVKMLNYSHSSDWDRRDIPESYFRTSSERIGLIFVLAYDMRLTGSYVIPSNCRPHRCIMMLVFVKGFHFLSGLGNWHQFMSIYDRSCGNTSRFSHVRTPDGMIFLFIYQKLTRTNLPISTGTKLNSYQITLPLTHTHFEA